MKIDGQRVIGCPRKQIEPEAYEMIGAYNAYEKGHTPVTLGRAEWVTGLYLQGVECVRACVAQASAEMHERQREKAKR